MPTADLILDTGLALVVISLLVIFRRERLARAAGEVSPTHPLLLGFYRSCALVIVVFAAFAVVMIFLSVLAGPTR